MEGLGGCGCQVFLQFVKGYSYDRNLANQPVTAPTIYDSMPFLAATPF